MRILLDHVQSGDRAQRFRHRGKSTAPDVFGGNHENSRRRRGQAFRFFGSRGDLDLHEILDADRSEVHWVCRALLVLIRGHTGYNPAKGQKARKTSYDLSSREHERKSIRVQEREGCTTLDASSQLHAGTSISKGARVSSR